MVPPYAAKLIYLPFVIVVIPNQANGILAGKKHK